MSTFPQSFWALIVPHFAFPVRLIRCRLPLCLPPSRCSFQWIDQFAPAFQLVDVFSQRFPHDKLLTKIRFNPQIQRTLHATEYNLSCEMIAVEFINQFDKSPIGRCTSIKLFYGRLLAHCLCSCARKAERERGSETRAQRPPLIFRRLWNATDNGSYSG